jgi:hypothetical protein
MTGASIHVVTLLLAALAAADAGSPARAPGVGAAVKPLVRTEVEAALTKSGAVGELSRLAATSPGPLMAIASDQAAPETVRARALAALAYARGGKVQPFLENFVVARTPPLDATDRLLSRWWRLCSRTPTPTSGWTPQWRWAWAERGTRRCPCARA